MYGERDRMKDEATREERQRAICNDNKKPNDKRIIAVSTMRKPMGRGPRLWSFIDGAYTQTHTLTHILKQLPF